jgi:hypothetical protein
VTDKPGNYGMLAGRYPAVVRSYDAQTRTCRVEIPGITDNADTFPLAEIEYNIGDKSKVGPNATEIEILPEDTIWVSFIAGDARYPIITGYRNPKSGNSVDVRRIHHANIELLATTALKIKAANINIEGNVAITGGTLTHQGKDVGSTHKHGGVQTGGGQTSVPV